MVLLSAVKLFENQCNRLHLFKTGTEMDCAALVCRSVPIVLKMHIENVSVRKAFFANLHSLIKNIYFRCNQ
jgi:hypothetical protein